MTDEKTIEIRLTGKRPVEIVEADWPVIASATWDDDSKNVGEWTRMVSIYVRADDQGDYLVYGKKNSQWEGERDESAGVLVRSTEGRDVEHAILEVADLLGNVGLGQWCIEQLPAERI